MSIMVIQDREVIFRRSRRARRLRLQMDNEGKLTLVSPWLTSKRSIQIFLEQHVSWIEKQWGKIERQNQLRPKPRYQNGDTFYYFGEAVTLEVHPSDRKRPVIKVRDDKMIITLYRNISKASGIAMVKKTIEQFYKKKATEVIHDRLQFFNEHYGFCYNRVTFRNQKTRWGSCSQAGNLNFNWRLIMAPIEMIDYVVVHEMCHLQEMNHSRKFWRLVEQTIPNHKEVKKWLKEFHYLLII